MHALEFANSVLFLSTLSLRRATIGPVSFFNSYPFLSTLSLRRATVQRGPRPHQWGHFYPRSPCGERRAGKDPQDLIAKISIHALLAESDGITPYLTGAFYISIHALLAESDMEPLSTSTKRGKFLSTLSLRRATRQRELHRQDIPISIHALLAESDFTGPRLKTSTAPFLSTLSLRRATQAIYGATAGAGNFYPRSPCGERRRHAAANGPYCHFYPRSPCGERPLRLELV